MSLATGTLPRTLDVIGRGVDDGLHIGAQLYVSRDGEPVADVAVGEADRGVAMTTETLMPWFSMTKAVTSTAAVLQWLNGAFDLDDPVAAHLPEFATHGKDGIRIRHLFTHTAGIRTADDPSSLSFAGKTPEQAWADAVAHVCAIAPEDGWVPGARAGYHLGSGMLVLAELVQRSTGTTFDRYVRDAIFGPLDMPDCWVGMPTDRFTSYGERMGRMHFTAAGDPQPFPLLASAEEAPIVVPGGGGRGPMNQLARLYEMFRSRDGLLPPVAIEAMTARHRAGLLDETYGVVVDWGLGLMLDAVAYGRHCSPRTFGHGGMQSSVAFCDPDAGLIVAMVFNGMPAMDAHYRRLDEVSSAIYEDLGLAEPGAAGRAHPMPTVTNVL